MSEKSKSKNLPPNSIDTLIGAGMLIDGDISWTGVLRIQGAVLGNVSCDGSPNGTLVVDSAGAVTGTISAEHIIVKGRVIGPLHSSQSIEVHQGASVVGDVSFKEIAVYRGGAVEGLLNPTTVMDSNGSLEKHLSQVQSRLAADKLPMPAAGKFMERLGGARMIRVAATLATIVATIAWVGRDSIFVNHPSDNIAVRADTSFKDSTDPKPDFAASGESQNGPNVVSGNAFPLATSTSVRAEDTTQPFSADSPGKVHEKVVTVKGANPSRPAGVFLLISNEPSVLYRKKREDPADGSRISVSQGEKVSITIALDDIIRVAKGRDISILYQGQKVPRHIIENGSWISFVPID